MLAKYAIIVRRAGAVTAVAAAVMVAVSAALAGVKGLYGALIGVAIVAVFFGLSVLVVGRAARGAATGSGPRVAPEVGHKLCAVR